MPFRSQAQWRWAFANKKPWAKRWADETPQKLTTLPKKVSKAMMGDDFPMSVDEESSEKEFRSQAQQKWAFATKKPWADRWAKETRRKRVSLPERVTKAATTGNFSARAGEKIGGNQCRDANGHFVNCDDVNAVGPNQQGQQGAVGSAALNTYAGSSMAAYEAASERAKIIENERKRAEKKRIRQEMGLEPPSKGGGGISPAERKRQEREGQKKNEYETHGAVGPGSALGLALSNFADPDNPGMLPNITANRLVELGLVEMSPRTGKPYITGEGRAYINAARSGDKFAAREAMQRAQDAAIEKREAAAQAEQGQLAQAEEEAFQREIEMIEGSPRDKKRQAALDRVARRETASARASAKPKKPESNNVYGSGKVTVGSPKSTVKETKTSAGHEIPLHILDAMYEGREIADRHGFKHVAMRFFEKGLVQEPLTKIDLIEMSAWHQSLKEKNATEDAPTADWFVYQLLGAQHGFYWIDSVMASYEMAVSTYKSKKSDFNRKPSATASVNAIRGLDLQYAYKKGGSDGKIALGEKIANQKPLSNREISAMHKYLTDHQNDRKAGWANPSDPSVEFIDWMIHGGDEGLQWANEKIESITRTEKAKAEEIDRTPSPTAATNAVRGLDLQYVFKRGGSKEMIDLGRRIANKFALDDDEIRSMHAYLHRHSDDRKDGWANPSDPSVAYINWMIHGGDEGLQWSSEKVEMLKLKREKLTETKGRRDEMMGKRPGASSSAGSDFVFPLEKRFPITDYASVTEALNSWPQYRGLSKYEEFQQNLTAIAQRKGLVEALPKAWQKNIENADENQAVESGMSKSTVKVHAGGKDSFSPPAGVRSAAKRGLELRSKFGRGGTSVGIARARDLSNGKGISASTIRRMNSFFARHAVDKRPDWSNPSKPSNGYIAHLLWGGDAGRSWASKISRHLDAKTKEYPSYVFNSHIDIYRHRNDEMLRKEQQRHRMQYSIKGRRQKTADSLKALESETTKGKNKPNNPSLWKQAIAEAKKKYRVYPSAYANGYAAQWYKKRGGTWKTEKDLRDWFDEKWVDISRPKKGGGYEPCGRRTEGMSESDYRKKYPKCVPASRTARMSESQRQSAIDRKRDDGLPKSGKPSMVSTVKKSTIIPSNVDLQNALGLRRKRAAKNGGNVVSAIVTM